MVKIYTKTGDNGETSLLYGKRASKSDPIFGVLGTLDELNASLGLVKAPKNRKINLLVEKVQNDLFALGSLLANPNAKQQPFTNLIDETAGIEKHIDSFNEELPPLANFIIPGGSQTASQLHLSRAISRRLERELVDYFENEKGTAARENVLRYVNRLSDLLFVLARYANFKNGVKDVLWKGL